MTKMRRIVPEVVQTSAMDCGPATLKALLGGHGIAVSYDRLREACQTDVDGTSIDQLEITAQQLGLNAVQTMLPPEHVLLPEAGALPAIAVVQMPGGATHFVLVWNRFGPWVQLMDPAVGRRWVRPRVLLDQLLRHRQVLDTGTWEAWVRSEGFQRCLQHRLKALGPLPQTENLRQRLLAEPGWAGWAIAWAALNLVERLVERRALRRGADSDALLCRLHGLASAGEREVIPPAFWPIEPLPSEAGLGDEPPLAPAQAEPPRGPMPESHWLCFTGAVLLSVSGVRRETETAAPDQLDSAATQTSETPPPLSRELSAALAEPEPRLWPLLREALASVTGHDAGYEAGYGGGHSTGQSAGPNGALSAYSAAAIWLALPVAALLAAGMLLLEALLLRGLLEQLGDVEAGAQRLSLLLGAAGLAGILWLVEWASQREWQRWGRHLELSLRLRFMRELPRLDDRYFNSRPVSDMAERAHGLHRLRQLPAWAAQVLRTSCEVLLTTAALLWLAPGLGAWVLTLALTVVLVPLLLQPWLDEIDLRARSHAGALGRFQLDALLGLSAVRAHGAQAAMRQQHESLLVEWRHAASRVWQVSLGAEALQSALAWGLAGFLLWQAHSQGLAGQGLVGTGHPAGDFLLLAYWVLKLPALGHQWVALARQWPAQRNTLRRFAEPFQSASPPEPEKEPTPPAPNVAATLPTQGLAIQLRQVSAVAAGHVLLHPLDLDIAPGSRVAIVGASGAGKSSLLGLLLGFTSPASGQLLIDGQPLDPNLLRPQTAWLEPGVALWNDSLLQNLAWGHERAFPEQLGQAVAEADLHGALRRMPQGLQTPLGESGGWLSGGEGQRGRLGRCLLRKDARLVLLDEPLRGLDRAQRQRLLQRLVHHTWPGATLLCVTHDIEFAQDFDRVLVLEQGRIVEDGLPSELATQPSSRFSALLKAEAQAQTQLWASPVWRRLWLADGQLQGQLQGLVTEPVPAPADQPPAESSAKALWEGVANAG